MILKTRSIQVYIILLVFIMSTGTGYSSGQKQFDSDVRLDGKYHFNGEKFDLGESSLQTLSRQLISDGYATDDLEQSLLLAQGGEKKDIENEAEMSEQCREFAKDPNADVGDIIRAGCKPTTAQRIGRWRTHLSLPDQRLVQSVAGGLLTELDYELADLGPMSLGEQVRLLSLARSVK